MKTLLTIVYVFEQLYISLPISMASILLLTDIFKIPTL